MPPTDAPTWWADVQQDREDLSPSGRRPADDWLGEDIDFVPRRRLVHGPGRTAVAEGAGHELHGVFVPAAHAPVRDGLGHAAEASSVIIELGTSPEPAHAASADEVGAELRRLRDAADAFSTSPPSPGGRRTVQITGRPGERRTASSAQRHRSRTAFDRIGPNPDRIAMWAVILGVLLILVAALTS